MTRAVQRPAVAPGLASSAEGTLDLRRPASGTQATKASGPSAALPPSHRQRLATALLSAGYSYTSGSTHNFYHYPARFSADIARAVIETFSKPGDLVIDPFMGGGTSIIEGLMLGRRMVGVDLNALAHFVARVRTTPLALEDERVLRTWALRCASHTERHPVGPPPEIKNLPKSVERFIAGAIKQSLQLSARRQRSFARCVLVRLGQWALDCRDSRPPDRQLLGRKLVGLTEDMLSGLRDFVRLCSEQGLSKREIVKNRLLLNRTAVGLNEDARVRAHSAEARLVFTSPPYPGVHVLYHRWQYRGRKETPAPYWIANVRDGYYESHYTGGSRTPTGLMRYFAMITAAFESVRAVIDPSGWVIQLMGFSDVATQLPRYLAAMREAGFEECHPAPSQAGRLGRSVPNRKWYAKLQGAVDAATEVLLIHRPR